MALSSDMIGFRVRKETKEALDAAAKDAGTSVADYLRTLVEQALETKKPGSATGEDSIQAEVKELRRDLAGGLEVLGVMMCRLFAKVSPAASSGAAEKEFRDWIAENLRRA